MVDAARARKLADRIQQIVAEMLERRIKDPRLGFVTVTDTRITNDLRDATVYYTVLRRRRRARRQRRGAGERQGRHPLGGGQQTGVRHTPSLTFVMDSLPDNAAPHRRPARQGPRRDAEVARAAQGASRPVTRTRTGPGRDEDDEPDAILDEDDATTRGR